MPALRPLAIAVAAAAGLLAWHGAGALAPHAFNAPAAMASRDAAVAAKAPAALVDINSASRAQLMSLPGIGDAEADRIIKSRPYLSKARLVADEVLSYERYLALKGRIVAVQKGPPPQRKP